MRGQALENGKLLLPVTLERGKLPVDIGWDGVLTPGLFALCPRAHAKHEDQPLFLSGSEFDLLLQCAAVVAAQLGAAAATSSLDCQRVRLRTIVAEEAVAQGVVAVGLKAGGKVVEGRWLVEEVVFDDCVIITCAAGIETHLQVLVVDFDVVEGELNIREDTQPARLGARIADVHIPQFDIVLDGNEQGFLGTDVLIVA